MYKDCGLTMKQFLNDINERYPDEKYTFTARLDPMACGLVPLIPKKEFKNIYSHYKYGKTYQVRVILGISTDSDDVLGKIEKLDESYFDDIDLKSFECYFEKKNITYNQKYHYFSSKRIYNRLKNKKDIEYTHPVTIYKSSILSKGKLYFSKWISQVIININKVDKEKDFRQTEIIEQWRIKNNCYDSKILNYIDLELKVSSGFYVRQFIRDISEKINIPMLAYKITRVSIDLNK